MTSAVHPMSRALQLARSALGTTSPNPSVGAVIVRESTVVGEGHTLPAGQHHAEIGALLQAGPAARGSTLYCTLEPCCHQGRTPPCTDAIINAGIARVIYAVRDPNPRVAGGGESALRAAGIAVEHQPDPDSEELYEAFARHITTGLPFVVAKFAMSLDGKIATRTGASQWITGPQARARVQQMRKELDGIMVGIGTTLTDDPQLTARDPDGHPLPSDLQPVRIVVDSQGRTPTNARMLREPGRTVIATGANVDRSRISALEEAGADVREFPGPDGRVQLSALLRSLGDDGLVSVLVEGGGEVMGAMLDAGLIDKVHAFVAPKLIGGAGASSPIGGNGATVMADVWNLDRARSEQIGPDWLITGYPTHGGD